MRRLALSLGAAVIVLAGTAFVAASAGTGDEPTWDPTSYERTKHLTGPDLLDALGAVTVEFVPGSDTATWSEGSISINDADVPGCPPVGAPEYVLIGMGDGAFACVGAADSEQARDIGLRAKANG